MATQAVLDYADEGLEIRAAILEGDIDRALQLVEHYYPNVLNSNPNINFKLKSRKFVEMIRRTTELAEVSSTTKRPSSSHDDYSGVFDQEMELDEYGTTARNGTSHHNNSWEDGGAMDLSDGLYSKGRKGLNHSEMLMETLQYGAQLRAEFDDDPRREVKQSLVDLLALIAYTDPKRSGLAPLLDDSERAPVAEELNGAILRSLGKSSSSALEKLIAQTEVILTELGADGGGALINLRSALRGSYHY